MRPTSPGSSLQVTGDGQPSNAEYDGGSPLAGCAAVAFLAREALAQPSFHLTSGSKETHLIAAQW